MTVYAIGDIHGQLDALKAAHERIATDMARRAAGRAQIVHVGDYADRGPDVKGVLDFLIARQAENPCVICLAGNHDRLMLGFLDSEAEIDPRSEAFDWLRPGMGSLETLASYGLQPGWTTTRGKLARQIADLVPPEHLEFLRNLPVRHKVGPYFFVHAGIDPDRSLDDQDEEDMLWIRAPFLNDRRDHGKLIVHGHTPVPEVVHAGNRVNIDTGAGFGRPLSAVALEGREVFVLTERGRVRVSPLADA